MPRRYFDPCFNCGNSGHIAAQCPNRQARPCYICGNFEHKAQNCPKMSGCHYCGKSGHKASACPRKIKAKDVRIKGYHPDDLKMVKCYICKQKGHLCCRNVLGEFKGDVSCYNCGELGHSGMACAFPNVREKAPAEKPAQISFKEEHYALGCMNTPNKRKRSPQPWNSRETGSTNGSKRSLCTGSTNGSKRSLCLREHPQMTEFNNSNNVGTLSYNDQVLFSIENPLKNTSGGLPPNDYASNSSKMPPRLPKQSSHWVGIHRRQLNHRGVVSYNQDFSFQNPSRNTFPMSGDRAVSDYSNGSQRSPWLPQTFRWMEIQTRQLNNWNNAGL